MARLLYANCPNCVHVCAAYQLTREMLDSMRKEEEKIFSGLMALTMVYVFCQRTEVFMPLELLG